MRQHLLTPNPVGQCDPMFSHFGDTYQAWERVRIRMRAFILFQEKEFGKIQISNGIFDHSNHFVKTRYRFNFF